MRSSYVSAERAASAIARQLRSLARSIPQLLTAIKPVATLAEKSKRRSPRLTAAQRKVLKLQGKYMGTMRRLGRSQVKRVKKHRVKFGVLAAIELAQKLR